MLFTIEIIRDQLTAKLTQAAIERIVDGNKFLAVTITIEKLSLVVHQMIEIYLFKIYSFFKN